MSVGRRLRQARLALRWSLRDVRERTNISISYLSEIERGIADPTLSTLLTLAGALDMSLNQLLTREPHRIAVTGRNLPAALERLAHECRALRVITPLHIAVKQAFDVDEDTGEIVPIGWTLILEGEDEV